MSDEPSTNAAVERFQVLMQFLNAADSLPDVIALSGDYEAEDRRTGLNVGSLDAATFQTSLGAAWDLGSGRPTFSITEIIAVRGDRCVAFSLNQDYGNEMNSPQICVLRFDSGLRSFQRLVVFDPEARDAAIVELDRMHAKIND